MTTGAPTPADRDEALAALRSTDRLLKATGDGLVAFDRELRYLYWSAVVAQLSGRSEREVVDRIAFEVFPSLAGTIEEQNMRAALAGRCVAGQEQPYQISATGRAGSYQAFYSPLTLPDGRIVGGVAVVRDTSERRSTEQQIREIETRFRNMADAAPVLLWMSDTDGLCTFFNRTWLEFTGRTLQQEWGVGWAEGVHFEEFQRCMDSYAAAFNRRVPLEMEYRLRRADGAYRWILDRGVPRYTPDGSFAGYIGSCIDITERRQVEGELRKAVRLRDEFLSIASHELRTPLTALQLRVESLLRSVRDPHNEALSPGRLERHATAAVSATEKLAQLIEELLDVSRISSERLVLERVAMDLSAAARDAAARLAPMLHEAACPLTLRADAPVPGTWDRSRVDQLLGNLLGNAIKYGAGKQIELTVQAGEHTALVTVRDQGIGIPADDQARIFERFERAVSPRHYGGLGLGLWISREIVRAHGGTISVVSEPGAGATFTVELPRG